MMTTNENSLTVNNSEVLVKMIFDRWHSSIRQTDELINALTDTQLENEISPGRNTGRYILGHLIAVHDNMLPLLGLGTKEFQVYNSFFIDAPDKKIKDTPSVKELRSAWNRQKEDLQTRFTSISNEGWFERHTAVTAEDFAKEPHRNKLNIILTRTSHLNYHTGQLILLK